MNVEVSIDGGLSWGPATFSDPNFSFELGRLEDGDYPVKARAFDALGVVGEAGPVTLVIDRLRPVIGGNIVAFGPQIVYPLSDGTIPSVAGVKTSFVMSMRGGVTQAKITANGKEFPLHALAGTNLWEGTVEVDQEGTYRLTVVAKDGAGHTETKVINDYQAREYGTVSDSVTKNPIDGAVVTLYAFDQNTKTWMMWDSESYGQHNAQVTGSMGHYSFFVPKGTYYMEVKKPGYQSSLSDIKTVDENTIVNTPVELTSYANLGVSFGYFIPRSFQFQIPQHPDRSEGAVLKTGTQIPPYSFSKPDGTDFTRRNEAGKKYVLVFFSPWSALSIEGISQISRTDVALPKTTEVIGVSVQESPSSVGTFVKRGLYNFSSVADFDGKYSSDLGVTTLPYYIFVDSKGNVQKTLTGVLSKEELQKTLENMQ